MAEILRSSRSLGMSVAGTTETGMGAWMAKILRSLGMSVAGTTETGMGA